MLRKPHIFSSHLLCFEVTRTCLQRHSVSIAWRLHREMRRWLILHKTGFTCERFLTSYFINMDTFHLFLNWFSTRVSDDQRYLCVHRLYMHINTPKFKDLDAREITSLPEIKKWLTWHVISIIVENKPHSHHKTHESLQHPTTAVLLMKILFFFNHSVCAPTRFGKALNLIFPKHLWLWSRNYS